MIDLGISPYYFLDVSAALLSVVVPLTYTVSALQTECLKSGPP